MAISHAPKKKVSAHDQKRHGLHHKRQTPHYAKTYWPYLPMLLIVGLGFLLNTTMTTGKAVLGYATSIAPTTLLQETNIQRSQNGQNVLTLNNKLAAAAQAKANDMISKDYWAHVAPDGTQPWQFISNAGYVYQSAGENLAYGFDTSAAAVAGWMNSPGHRANILNASYTEVGFGIADGDNYQHNGQQTVVVAMYGQPQQVVTPSTVKNGTAPLSIAAQVPALAAAADDPVPTASTKQPETAAAAPTTRNSEPYLLEQNDADAVQATELQARQVSRIDVLTNGNAAWASMVLAILAAIGAVVFFYKHAKLWKKLLVRGESFIIHHPLLDIAFVFVAVAGFLLTRTTGFIH
jgi:uncharacterized protein YkwD